MILRSSPASPFARKVRIAAAVLGLANKIEVRETDLNDPADPIRVQNPLGKIPVLILDDGTVYYDSRVILEYLDHLAGGGRIIPREPKARFAALRLAGAVRRHPRCLRFCWSTRAATGRPTSTCRVWIDRQADKVARGLAALEAAPPTLGPVPDVGQIALACVLGYRDLRFDGSWRKDHPRLLAWHDKFAAQVPAFAATKAAA